ncbi:hypothetical protein KFE25_007281 [Diacronema lutheri]|uniref:Uncharacterized protein n=1 Tax=Diacronema lutheri TaxID=2081491 RepID=A0A8J5XNZ8_DIALT|nr:hypothetical protein KFE25_007281 [Diacronema lutheri]
MPPVCAEQVEMDGYAPFIAGELAASCSPVSAEMCITSSAARSDMPSEARSDSGVDCGDEDYEYDELDGDAVQAQLIDELVRQLLTARRELEERGAQLEARECEVRYLQQALLQKDAHANKLQTKLDALSRALGSRLERVSGALGRAPHTPKSALAPLDANGLTLHPAERPRPLHAAAPAGGLPVVAKPPVTRLSAESPPPRPAALLPAAGDAGEQTNQPSTPETRRHTPTASAASGAQLPQSGAAAVCADSRWCEAGATMAPPSGILFSGIEPDAFAPPSSPRADSPPARLPCGASPQRRAPRERPTPRALQRAIGGAHAALAAGPMHAARCDDEYAAKLVEATRDAARAQAAAFAVKVFSRRLSRSLKAEHAASMRANARRAPAVDIPAVRATGGGR